MMMGGRWRTAWMLLLWTALLQEEENCHALAFLVEKSSMGRTMPTLLGTSKSSGTSRLFVATESSSQRDSDTGLENNGNKDLAEFDPVMASLIAAEEKRQHIGLELIASENFASRAVREALGSCLTNKYSEGGGESLMFCEWCG